MLHEVCHVVFHANPIDSRCQLPWQRDARLLGKRYEHAVELQELFLNRQLTKCGVDNGGILDLPIEFGKRGVDFLEVVVDRHNFVIDMVESGLRGRYDLITNNRSHRVFDDVAYLLEILLG